MTQYLYSKQQFISDVSLNGSTTMSSVNVTGNVGIGTTNPAEKLHINGGNLRINSTTSQLANFATSSTESCFMDFNNSGSAGRLCIGVNGTGFGGNGFTNCGTIGTWSNTALTFATNQTERMRITAAGYIGIGTASPTYPIHLTGVSPNSIGLTTGYINKAATTTWYTETIDSYIGIYSQYGIYTGDVIYGQWVMTFSDKRIKDNIVDIDDEKALQILRLIKPKTYEYVDKLKRGSDSVIGFIAQEIKSILPKAVSITKDYIPNFFTNCVVSTTDASNIVLVTSPIDLSWNPLHGSAGSANASNASDQSGNAFIDADGNACSDAAGNKSFNVKLYDQSNNEIICKTTSILDKRSFLMDVTETKMAENLQETYFLHGQEVDDFHNIDKSAIFTVVTAAVQDIDRIVQAQAAKIIELENKNATLESLVAQQQAQINAILAKIGGV